MYQDPVTGLVPCKILKPSGSSGVRKDEIRGFPLKQAQTLEKSEHVKALTAKEVEDIKKEKKAKAKASAKPEAPAA